MTSDPGDQPVPMILQLKEGIYLEKKMSSIGTGSTAKTVEYRNFWATGSLEADFAVMILLDNEFKPTSLKETFSLEVLTGPNWFFIAEGEKKYQFLRPQLDQIMSPQPQSAKAETPAAPSSPKWWEGDVPAGPPANPFELKKTAKKAPPKKGGWWDT